MIKCTLLCPQSTHTCYNTGAFLLLLKHQLWNFCQCFHGHEPGAQGFLINPTETVGKWQKTKTQLRVTVKNWIKPRSNPCMNIEDWGTPLAVWMHISVRAKAVSTAQTLAGIDATTRHETWRPGQSLIIRSLCLMKLNALLLLLATTFVLGKI